MRHVFKLMTCVCLLTLATDIGAGQNGESDRYEQSLRRGDLASGFQQLTARIANDPNNARLQYLKGEVLLLRGAADAVEILEIINTLRQSGEAQYADILALKTSLLLGTDDTAVQLARCEARYPSHPEVRLVRWLYRLDRGDFEWAASHYDFQTEILFPWIPLRALMCEAVDRDYATARQYLHQLREISDLQYHRLDHLLAAQPAGLPMVQKTPAYQVRYLDRLPVQGIWMTDAAGNDIAMTVDTGTSTHGVTVHSDSAGQQLQGEIQYINEDGIKYNYMDSPADVTGKSVDFRSPPIQNLLVEYFAGRFRTADGCFSPLIFRNRALTLDPFKKEAWIRDATGLQEYLDSLEDSQYTTVDYILRNGWIFIPCTVNDTRTVMMLETGSSDVNFTSLSARKLGLNPYESTIDWRGKTYPVTRVDTEIAVGEFTYMVRGGLVHAFVMGNNGYGVASSGDIGPLFLQHYVTTFDNIHQQVILAKPAG